MKLEKSCFHTGMTLGLVTDSPTYNGFAEVGPGVFHGVVINPEVMPPDDIDKIILSDLRDEALEEFKKVLDKV